MYIVTNEELQRLRELYWEWRQGLSKSCTEQCAQEYDLYWARRIREEVVDAGQKDRAA